MNQVLLTEQSFAETIAECGGRVFRVGGCVRDQFMGVIPKDIDFCIVGMVKKNFKAIFPDAEERGKSFPVFHLFIDGVKCELAFARTERKVSSGYKGFKVSAKPKIKIEEDLYRRDTTINSIAMDCLTGEIVDPFKGVEDIQSKLLRATSEHFPDDPMRSLRLAGQSARFGFTIHPETLILASAVVDELRDEPAERMLMELTKVLNDAQEPSTFFRVLAETKLLPVTFQEISNLPKENFERAMVALDGVAQLTKSPKLRFAALGLVLDKETLLSWDHKMKLPGDWLDSAITMNKFTGLLEIPSAEKIVMAISTLRRGALSVEEFDMVTRGARLDLPVLGTFKAAMSTFQQSDMPKELKGKEIGEWLRKKHIEMIGKIL
ncbi:polynucleotide adenylyltransferase [Pelosinus sp. sgz500959]|uniref:polynucleotide adenylyltransferase n=1 Tax=Pelosinus sp. sgz500959 TaxID=3242472 RepID=UPI00367159A4